MGLSFNSYLFYLKDEPKIITIKCIEAIRDLNNMIFGGINKYIFSLRLPLNTLFLY